MDQRGGFFGVNLKRLRLGMESWCIFFSYGELMAGLWVSFSGREFDTLLEFIFGEDHLWNREYRGSNPTYEYFKK